MINFNVSIAKQTQLQAKMLKLNILEKDLEEQFIHSGGKGGQNVNKVATCVRLKHLPTGLEVKCQKARTQNLNRYLARVMLFKKIEDAVLGRQSEEQQKIFKIRKQKKKRSRRAKEKILAQKKEQSAKKELRKSISDNERY